MNDAVDVFVVRYRLLPDVEAADVRRVVADAIPGLEGTGAQALVPIEGAYTVSVYATVVDDRPCVEWYVELDRGVVADGAFADPGAWLREHSPLFAAGLADLVAEDAPVTVFDADDCPLHETHPRRPSRFVERRDDAPFVLSPGVDAEGDPGAEGDPDADDDPEAATAPTPEIAATRIAIQGGLAGRFVDLLAWLLHAVDDDGAVEGQFEEWSEPVIADEAMYTESFVLERVDGRRYLDYYMEADTVQGVYDAYEDSSSLVARVSEVVMRRIFVEPLRMLGDIVAHSDHVPLVHAVAPKRP
jgi:hypothetical protein